MPVGNSFWYGSDVVPVMHLRRDPNSAGCRFVARLRLRVLVICAPHLPKFVKSLLPET